MVVRRTKRQRGFSLLEAIAAGVILAVSLVALFSLWNVCFIRIQSSGEISSASQLARAELERAKIFGASNFPIGTYNSGTGVATWTGSFDPTANSGAGNWVSNDFEYYDLAGTRVATSTTAGARYSVQISVIDSGVLVGTGNSYTLAVTSRRAMVATVRRLPEDAVIFTAATNIVVGGL